MLKGSLGLLEAMQRQAMEACYGVVYHRGLSLALYTNQHHQWAPGIARLQDSCYVWAARPSLQRVGGITRKRSFQILVSVHSRSITQTFIFDCRCKNVHSEIWKKAIFVHSSYSYFIVINPELHSIIITGWVVLTLTIHIGWEHSIFATEVVRQLWLILHESVPLPCHNAPMRDLALMGKQDSHFHCLVTKRLLQSFMSWAITMHEVQYLKRKATATTVSILRSICSM